jgi:hypothetical protein
MYFPKTYNVTSLYCPIVKWVYCRSHLTTSFVRHVGIITCRKLKDTILQYTPMPQRPNLIQIHPAILELIYKDRWTDRRGQPYVCVNFIKIVQTMHNNL